MDYSKLQQYYPGINLDTYSNIEKASLLERIEREAQTKHEKKNCPRCNTLFECKVGSITLCQCMKAELTSDERENIGLQYNDCLCINCILELKGYDKKD